MSALDKSAVEQALESIERRATGKDRAQYSETARILALPTMPSSFPDLTEQFRRPGGTLNLFPIQSQALYAAHLSRGLLGLIGVGHGKTLISLLLPHVFQAKRPVLLLPAPMIEQFFREREKFGQHFVVARNLRPISYSRISTHKGALLLKELQPDLIIADEAHYLRHKASARTKRVLRYLKENPNVVFCALSGTLTSKSIRDYAHIAEHALHDNSPLPRPSADWPMLEAWANCLDSGERPRPEDWRRVEQFFRALAGPKPVLDMENFRRAFQFRLLQTPGVVATSQSSISSTLVIRHVHLPMSDAVQQAYRTLQRTWKSPDGQEEIPDAMTFARYARHLSQGFYYRWEWGPEGPNYPWLLARQTWFREVRRYLSSPPEGIDSVFLVASACSQGRPEVVRDKNLMDAWRVWQQFKHIKEPPTTTVWVSDYLVHDAVRWAKAQRVPVILWYESLAMEQAFRAAGIPVFGQGTEVPQNAITCAMSIKVHGTGKNLQAWSLQRVVSPPSSGAAWEQLLGRTHRVGQTADEIVCEVYQHTTAFVDAFNAARRDSEYIERTQGTRQKLNYAVYVTHKIEYPEEDS